MSRLIPEVFLPLLTKESAPADWTNAMSVALTASEFANTWSQDAGSACRAVFLFPDGLAITWAGTGCGDEPTTVQVWADPERAAWYPNGAPFTEPPCASPVDHDDLEWDAQVQCWAVDLDAEEVAKFISSAVAGHGPCELMLPWETFCNDEAPESLLTLASGEGSFLDRVNALTEEQQEEFLEGLDLFDEDEDSPAAMFPVVLAAAAVDGVVLPTVWGGTPAKVYMGDAYLIPGSPLAKFYEFVEVFEEKPNWVVIWNECCGTCFRGSYEWAVKDKGLEPGAPSLALFGQNAQYEWMPDSTLNAGLYQNNEDEVREIVAEATKVGLRARVDAAEPCRVTLF